jgi:hypothetical protein
MLPWLAHHPSPPWHPRSAPRPSLADQARWAEHPQDKRVSRLYSWYRLNGRLPSRKKGCGCPGMRGSSRYPGLRSRLPLPRVARVRFTRGYLTFGREGSGLSIAGPGRCRDLGPVFPEGKVAPGAAQRNPGYREPAAQPGAAPARRASRGRRDSPRIPGPPPAGGVRGVASGSPVRFLPGRSRPPGAVRAAGGWLLRSPPVP